MKKIIRIFVVFILITACTPKNNALQSEFTCVSKSQFGKLEKVSDFKNTFTIKVPENWKTTLYYDQAQSSVMCADTTKILTQAYVTEFAMLSGNITMDETFSKTVNETSARNQLKKKSEKFIKFNNFDGFYHLSDGFRDSISMQVLQYYLKR